MITAIQRFLEKHSKWLFITLLVVVIIPFVFTIGAMPGFSGNRRGKSQKFFSIDFNSPAQVERAQLATAISLSAQKGSPRLQTEALFARLTWLNLAQQIGIPVPTDEQLKNFIRQEPAFLEKGQFSSKSYENFLKALRNGEKSLESIAAETFREDWQAQLLVNTIINTPISQEYEALLLWRLMNSHWTVQAIRIPLKNFHPEISPKESELLQFFESTKQVYQIPEKVVIRSVFFSDVTPETASVTDEALKKFFIDEQRIEGKGMDLAEFEQNREKIQQQFLAVRARQNALKTAGDFAYQIYKKNARAGSPEIAKIAQNFSGQIEEIPAFSRNEPPAYRQMEKNLLALAFDLTDEHFFSDPLPVKGGAVVFLLEKKIEAQDVAYESVREKVADLYKKRERLRLFMERGRDLRNESKNFQSFSDLARWAQAQGLILEEFKDFTVEKLPESLTPEVASALLMIKEGEPTPLIPQKPDLVFLRLVKYQQTTAQPPLDLIQKSASELSQKTKQSFAAEILKELMEREMGKNFRN